MSVLLLGLDYPDPDVIRVDDTYYLISTTMHFFPGGEILRSYDLVHWEWVAHVFDGLEDRPRPQVGDLYGKGMWAASLRHHQGTFYVVFVANDTHKTYLFRSQAITGPWQKSQVEGFYHDASLLFDGDRVFLAWGNTEIRLTELSADLRGPLVGGLDRVVVRDTLPRPLGYEGCHFYRLRGRYYLFLIHSRADRWRRVQSCHWSDTLEGPFEGADVFDEDLGYGDQGVAQGGVVDTPDGRWFAVLFQDRGGLGRVPVLVPLEWDGPRPRLGGPDLDGAPLPASTRPTHVYRPLVGGEDFSGELGPQWQWNHPPVAALWRLEGGRLRVTTDRVVPLLGLALNTLTQRLQFPRCSAEVSVDGSQLRPGDLAGLAALQSSWAAIALERTEAGWQLVVCHRTADDGPDTVVQRLPWSSATVRLRLEASFSATRDQAEFSYWNHSHWVRLGPAHPLVFKLDHFVGCRVALFTMATQVPGGEAAFGEFRYASSGALQ